MKLRMQKRRRYEELHKISIIEIIEKNSSLLEEKIRFGINRSVIA